MKNVCIVGCGSIAPVHAASLLKIPEVRLFAVCDIVKARADKIAASSGAKAYYSFDDALNDESIDFYHICTPHYLHFDMIDAVLKSGRSAVTEKPAVMTLKELEKASSWDETRVFPIFQNRHNASIKELLRAYESGETGKLTGIKANHTWKRTKEYYESGKWRGKKLTEGGGVLINQAIHTLDLALLIGGKVISLEAETANHSLKGSIDVEDTAEIYAKFESGASLNFYATNANIADSAPFIEYYFENGVYRYDNYTLYINGSPVAFDRADAPGKPCWGGGHEAEFSDIYIHKKNYGMKRVENTLKTVFAAYKSAAFGGKEIIL